MTVTFLEMKARPAVIPPPHPQGKAAMLRAETPPLHFYRYLYDAIGGPYFWVDRKRLDDASLAAVIQHPEVELYVLYVNGCPAGMAELDFRDPKTGLIAYFGLMPEFIGKRLGYFFLYHSVANAWAHPISTLLVNTCTLDHPRALPLYQRMGFVPYSREERCVELL
ncbi:MAG: GNAT family N-acetyltransferase [Alphaproteobacteria bacterium]|nr:GNAT family N-acetyltransferase [Alphaproteobacteria bacterium]